MKADKIDWDALRGVGGQVWQMLGGYEIGGLLLHQRFHGNAKLAAEWVGLSPSTMQHCFRKLGLGCHGKHTGRKSIMFQRNERFSDARTVEDLDAEYLEQSEAQERVLEYEWKVPRGTKEVCLVPISDLHLGSKHCDYKRFVELVEWIAATPTARWFLGGDNFDLATTGSPGLLREQFCELNEALDLLTMRLRPITSQGIAIFTGNHDRRITRLLQANLDPSEELANRLGLPFWGYEGHLTYKLIINGKVKQMYTHYHHHGAGASQTRGAKVSRADRIAATTNADIVTVGHLHQEMAWRDIRFGPNEQGLVVAYGQHRVLLPSFLKHRGYPAEMGLPPADLGAISIWLGVDKHSVHVRR